MPENSTSSQAGNDAGRAQGIVSPKTTETINRIIDAFDPSSKAYRDGVFVSLGRIKSVSLKKAKDLEVELAQLIRMSPATAGNLLDGKGKVPSREQLVQILGWLKTHFVSEPDALSYVIAPLVPHFTSATPGNLLDGWLGEVTAAPKMMDNIGGSYLSLRTAWDNNKAFAVVGCTRITAQDGFAFYESFRPNDASSTGRGRSGNITGGLSSARPTSSAIRHVGEGVLYPLQYGVIGLMGRTLDPANKVFLRSGLFQDATQGERTILAGSISTICEVTRTPLVSSAILYGESSQDGQRYEQCSALGRFPLDSLASALSEWIDPGSMSHIVEVLRSNLSAAQRPAEHYRKLVAESGVY